MGMTRDEHLAWAKKRALEYVDRDPAGAMASMVSDLRKHPELANHSAIEIGGMMMLSGFLSSPHEARRFIEGFN